MVYLSLYNLLNFGYVNIPWKAYVKSKFIEMSLTRVVILNQHLSSFNGYVLHRFFCRIVNFSFM